MKGSIMIDLDFYFKFEHSRNEETIIYFTIALGGIDER